VGGDGHVKVLEVGREDGGKVFEGEDDGEAG
jgi:hypothetical protein